MNNGFGGIPGMGGLMEGGFAPDGRLVINGDITIINEREYGNRGGFSSGMQMAMAQQQLMMHQQQMLAAATMKNVLALASAVAGNTLQKNMGIEAPEVQQPRQLLPEYIQQDHPQDTRPSKFDSSDVVDVTVEVVNANEIAPFCPEVPPPLANDFDGYEKTHPYLDFFSIENKTKLREEIIKTISAQYTEKDPSKRTCVIHQVPAHGSCKFDIAFVANWYDQSWRTTINNSKPKKGITLKGSVPTQDYLIFFFDNAVRINNVAYVSPISVIDYFDEKKVEEAFEKSATTVSVIAQIIREEFPTVKRFDHILDAVPTKDIDKRNFYRMCDLMHRENYGTDTLRITSICSDAEHTISDVIPIELYTTCVRKYTIEE